MLIKSWQKRLLPPEQHEMNGACNLAALLLNDNRLDELSKYCVKEHIAQLQAKTDLLLNTKMVC